jgi:hypothetical protein
MLTHTPALLYCPAIQTSARLTAGDAMVAMTTGAEASAITARPPRPTAAAHGSCSSPHRTPTWLDRRSIRRTCCGVWRLDATEFDCGFAPWLVGRLDAHSALDGSKRCA